MIIEVGASPRYNHLTQVLLHNLVSYFGAFSIVASSTLLRANMSSHLGWVGMPLIHTLSRIRITNGVWAKSIYQKYNVSTCLDFDKSLGQRHHVWFSIVMSSSSLLPHGEHKDFIIYMSSIMFLLHCRRNGLFHSFWSFSLLYVRCLPISAHAYF